MLFSDYLIETSYMELYDNIFEGNIEVSEVEVIEDSPTGYKAQFYVDEHEVNVIIEISGENYTIVFSVDGSFDQVNVGARAALIIIRGITKVVSDYLTANKDNVNVVKFSADTRRGRRGVYNILAKSIEAHGYLDFSYIYHPYNKKKYLYVKEGLSKYYRIYKNHDINSGIDEFTIILDVSSGSLLSVFSFDVLNTEAKIKYMIPITPEGESLKEVFRKSISEIFNTKLSEWDDADIDTILCNKKGGYQDGIIDGIIKRYGYTPIDDDDDSILYKRLK